MEEFAARAIAVGNGKAIEQPLQGLTILLVEDSRYFSDAVRLMAIRSGARIRRADCLSSAQKHIRIYRPDIVVIDIGLPDGSGNEFIKDATSVQNHPPIIAISGDNSEEVRQAAIESGAKLFVQKPFFDIASFQQTVRSVLPNSEPQKKFEPRVVGKNVTPDEASLAEDLLHINEIVARALPSEDIPQIKYCAQFLSSVARVAGDKELIKEANLLKERVKLGQRWQNCCVRIQNLIQERISP